MEEWLSAEMKLNTERSIRDQGSIEDLEHLVCFSISIHVCQCKIKIWVYNPTTRPHIWDSDSFFQNSHLANYTSFTFKSVGGWEWERDCCNGCPHGIWNDSPTFNDSATSNSEAAKKNQLTIPTLFSPSLSRIIASSLVVHHFGMRKIVNLKGQASRRGRSL